MTELTTDRELREALARFVDEHTSAVDDAVAHVERRVARRRRHRQSIAGVVVAAAAIALTSGVLLSRRNDNDHQRIGTVSPPSGVAPAPRIVTDPSGVQSLPAAPRFGPRPDAAVVWTGEEIVVWGGGAEGPASDQGVAPFNDGAAFNPSTGTWRQISASPITRSQDRSVATMTPAGVLITRGRETALWNPRTDSWTSLPGAPALVNDLNAIGSVAVSYSANARFDIDSMQWVALPDQPLNLERAAIAATDHQLFVIGGPDSPFTSARAMAYDPTKDEWRTLTDPPSDLHAEALSADWDGTRVVVVNYDMRAVAYYPITNRWVDLPNIPARFSEWYPLLKSSGARSVAFMSGAVAVLTAGDKWVPLPYGSMHFGKTIAVGGGTIVVWDGEGLIAADLDRIIASPLRLQVGSGSVLSLFFELVDARFDPGNPDVVERTTIVLRQTVDSTCTVTSGYGATSPPGISETLTNDGKATEWFHDPSERMWWTNPTSSDVLTIECTSSNLARGLAESASFVFSQ
jgi:hypothetical protein